MSSQGLRGVMTPAMVGVMTPKRFTVGQLVRFVGKPGTINRGTVGSVQRMDDVLTTCPVVWFPRTLGPYSTFTITRPGTDLEAVDPCLCKNTTTGTWYGQNHDAECEHAR